jgi:hypothetical protein
MVDEMFPGRGSAIPAYVSSPAGTGYLEGER